VELSQIDFDTIDLDWFAIDAYGYVGHFTTGGRGAIPRSVTASVDGIRTLTAFFRRTLGPTTSVTIGKRLSVHFTFEDELARTRYLQDFTQMASRGLFSFDYLPGDPYPAGYFLVAAPERPVHYHSLPTTIQRILLETTLQNVSFPSGQEIRDLDGGFRNCDVTPSTPIVARTIH
jgi:hypothetical protein